LPYDISDRLINIFRKISVDQFNSTFKTLKDKIPIEVPKYKPEDPADCGAGIQKMSQNGQLAGATTIQESG